MYDTRHPQLYGNATGISQRETNLCFAWSRALRSDEVEHHVRAGLLTFTDFLEVCYIMCATVSTLRRTKGLGARCVP